MRRLLAMALAMVTTSAAAQEKAVGFEPYFGVNGGYHEFDRRVDADSGIQGKTEGALPAASSASTCRSGRSSWEPKAMAPRASATSTGNMA